ncbi:hypothetical protein BRADI_3g17511v3 [Brachypodium distachyon]|uniref:Uncharacterized protein n=1 Tax=Brachypodium distachyon TaxID=15368 RepID=A0A2K2CXT0_BRADI|nr:hypothetical protein BRADI_3g17511v3 [Brachypodium distachyon]
MATLDFIEGLPRSKRVNCMYSRGIQILSLCFFDYSTPDEFVLPPSDCFCASEIGSLGLGTRYAIQPPRFKSSRIQI